jgi:TIR domain/von Willebrand factor type A domain
MGNPFESSAAAPGRTRGTQEHIKLEAAKDSLREHLAGLGRPTPVLLIAFDDTASIAFEGSSDDRAGLEAALSSITPRGGTDVAAAFDLAASDASASAQVRALLISDGLAEAEASGAGAERARAGGVGFVDVILIDPTEQGLDVARRIAAGGSVTSVSSAAELAQDVGRAAREQQLATGDPEAIAAVRRADARQVLERAVPGEAVAFTAAFPGAIVAGTWYSLLLYLHLERLQSIVDDLVGRRAEDLGSTPTSTRASAFSQIPRGTILRLRPLVAGLVFNPSSQEVAWLEDVQEAAFRLRAPTDAEPQALTGALEVYAGPLLVALLPLAIRVRGPGETDELTTSRTTQPPLQQVFASYSHSDEEIIRACAEAYTAFGIHMLIDKTALRSGQRWNETLHVLIDQSDQFQLYWSTSAGESKYVAEEWRHALELQGLKGEGFIRPLYWERPPPRPPPELAHLHFARLDLMQLTRAAQPQPAGDGTRAAREMIPAPVVPLLPFLSDARVEEARVDAGEAAAFVEAVTGLRYYPAPTLLVDEHAVRTVRAVEAPGERRLPEAVSPGLDVLGAICLTFHSLSFRPGLDRETSAARFGSATLLPADEWEQLRRDSESLLHFVSQRYRDPMPEVAPTFELSSDSGRSPSLEALETFFARVRACLEEGLRAGGDFHCDLPYRVEAESWTIVSTFAPSELETIEPEPSIWEQEPQLQVAGRFADVVQLFQEGARRVMEILRGASASPDRLLRAIETIVPTYGIYASPSSRSSDAALYEWAIGRGIEPSLTLPGTPRVLLCLGAQERFADALREGRPAADAERLACSFQRSVLAHEHFHSALETGLDAERKPAVAATDAASWQRGLRVNEALAAWMEVHLARDDPSLSDAVWAYIRAGPYPIWPYRGAELVEAVFSRSGIDGVRGLIDQFRYDPDHAGAELDAFA